MMFSIFSCVCQPSLCPWRHICLGLFPTFWLGCLFFWYWVVWAACIFWKLILCQLFHLLLFFSHSEGFLFTLLIVSFAVQKLLSLIRSHLFTFVFYFHSRRWVIEDLALIYIIKCSACVFSKSFTVSGL